MSRVFRILLVLTTAIYFMGKTVDAFPESTQSAQCNRRDPVGRFDDKLAEQLRAIALRYKEQFIIPGMLIGVWIPSNGKLIIEEGVADLATNRPISVADHVRIASITKSFTTTVILQQAQRGLLSLDSAVNDFIPGLQNGTASLEQLANMRSGIFNYTEDISFVIEFISDPLKQWLPKELVNVANANAAYFPPDADWHYSNTNTVMLGMIAEQVSRNSLAKEITKRIIRPLGLRETSYPETPQMPEPFARGYVGPAPFADFTLVDPSATAGSGAMISTLDDLRCWGDALGNGSLLSKRAQKERIASLKPIHFSPCADTQPDREKFDCPEYDRYGNGLGELSGWIGHTGDFVGYQSLVMYEPKTKSVVVIIINLSNVGGHLPTKIFREYSAILNHIFHDDR